jgi:hypothetical protein
MSESSPLRNAVAGPVVTHYGVRTELRLQGASDAGARYEARWFLGSKQAPADPGAATATAAPDAHGVATVGTSGEVSIEVTGGRLPEWAIGFTEKLLRTTARDARAGRFPRRLTRWRDGPA